MRYSDRLPAGTVLCDRYRLDGYVGNGAMGTVYRATHLKIGGTFAVKVMNASHPGGSLHSRFKREARTGAQLNHPNLVRISDADTDPATGCDFFVMELLEGETLRERMDQESPMPPESAAAILVEAATGLAAGHLHRFRMVHRDVKPANLFLERREDGGIRVRVLDLGVAQLLEGDDDTLTTTDKLVGTRAYAAPEQHRGGKVLPSADVFALGVIAFEMLAGQRPFGESDWEEMAGGGEVSPPSLLDLVPSLSPDLDALVRRALAHDPAKRFADGAAFAAELRRALPGVGPIPDVEAAAQAGAESSASRGAREDAGASRGPAADPSASAGERSREAPGPRGPDRRLDEPYSFRTDHNEYVRVWTLAELADRLEQNPVIGAVMLYGDWFKSSPWVTADAMLGAALELITRDRYPKDKQAGLIAAVHVFDPARPYRAGAESISTYAALARHLLDERDTYVDALRSPTHRLWLYLRSRPDGRVGSQVDAHAAGLARPNPRERLGALHRLVVWLRALDGETAFPSEDRVLHHPTVLASFDGAARAWAAEALRDEHSLLSAWVDAVGGGPGGTPLGRTWRARGGKPDELVWMLEGGVRVGDGMVCTPDDAVRGDPGVLAALWDGPDAVRATVSAWLEAYHGEPLFAVAFRWLRDETSLLEPHLPRVQAYVAVDAEALTGRLAAAMPASKATPAEVASALAAEGAGGRPASFRSWMDGLTRGGSDARVDAAIAREQWRVLVATVVPGVVSSLIPPRAGQAPSPASQAVVDALADLAVRMLKGPGVVTHPLHRLALWLWSVSDELDDLGPLSPDRMWWERFLTRLDPTLASMHRDGCTRLHGPKAPAASALTPVLSAGESLAALRLEKHAVTALLAAGADFPFLARFQGEEREAERRGATIDASLLALRGADQLAREAAELEALARLRKEAKEGKEFARLSPGIAFSWVIVGACATFGGWFLYHFAPVWDAFGAARDAAPPALRPWSGGEWWVPVWAALGGVAGDLVPEMIWAYGLPLLGAVAVAGIAIFSRVSEAPGCIFFIVAGVLVLGPVAGIASFPAFAAAFGPVYLLVLTGVAAWFWMSANENRLERADALAAVVQSEAYQKECARIAEETGRSERARRAAMLLEARRAVAISAQPSEARAPRFPAIKASPSRSGRLRVFRDRVERRPRLAANLGLALALAAVALAADLVAPSLRYRLMARPAWYVLESYWSEDDRDDAKEHASRYPWRTTRVVELADRARVSGAVVVLRGPYADPARAREAAVESDGEVYSARDLALW